MATECKLNYAVHPGILLQEEIAALHMTQKEVAERAGVGRTVINEVIKGKRGINAELAVRLESVLESPARFWLNAQSLYDEAMARAKLRKAELSAAKAVS